MEFLTKIGFSSGIPVDAKLLFQRPEFYLLTGRSNWEKIKPTAFAATIFLF